MTMESAAQNNLGVKVCGNSSDLQVIEEASDNEDDTHRDNGGSSISPYFPKDLVQPVSSPVFGSVAVTDSNHVHFGDKYIKIFNGPVNIKQIVQPTTGIDNVSYIKTEDDNHQKCQPRKESPIQKFEVQMWHKVTFSAIGVILIGSICAVILLTQNKNGQDDVDISQYYNTSDSASDQLLISPHHLRIVSRTDWLAQPVEEALDKIRQPVPWVIVTHTATESCHIQSSCVLAVRLMQSFHVESRGWFDIGYNFLVGGDGSAYYGRGWDDIGAHTKGYNKYSIGIAFIGTFNKESPTRQQVDACRKLIRLGVEQGKLDKNYKLFVHRQLMSTLSPGDKVYDIVKEWPHFVKNYTRDLIPNY